MKNILLLFLFLSLCTNMSFGQKLYKNKYKEKLEKNSRLIRSDYNFTFEKLPNKTFVFKRYYPENKMITHFYTYKDRKLKTLNGLCQERYDDGTIVNSGNYVDNSKEGEWVEDRFYSGKYKSDLREGEWVRVDEDNRKKELLNYLNGKLHGTIISYDTLGVEVDQSVYVKGEMISTTRDTSYKVLEQAPRFPGCESYGLEGEELDSCASKKMLKYVYGNLKYPEFARKHNIQGQALLTFVIDKNGNVTDLKVLRGVCKEIKEEIVPLVKSMSQWSPGYQNGKVIKVKYTLPIQFKLE